MISPSYIGLKLLTSYTTQGRVRPQIWRTFSRHPSRTRLDFECRLYIPCSFLPSWNHYKVMTKFQHSIKNSPKIHFFIGCISETEQFTSKCLKSQIKPRKYQQNENRCFKLPSRGSQWIQTPSLVTITCQSSNQLWNSKTLYGFLNSRSHKCCILMLGTYLKFPPRVHTCQHNETH